jgi:hypothetical protein
MEDRLVVPRKSVSSGRLEFTFKQGNYVLYALLFFHEVLMFRLSELFVAGMEIAYKLRCSHKLLVGRDEFPFLRFGIELRQGADSQSRPKFR